MVGLAGFSKESITPSARRSIAGGIVLEMIPAFWDNLPIEKLEEITWERGREAALRESRRAKTLRQVSSI
jgi:hypothetical protein